MLSPMNSTRAAPLRAPDDDPGAIYDLDRLCAVARLMDSALRIPGTKVTVGFDALVGLLPGIGDALSAFVSLWIVAESRRLGARHPTLALMLLNVALDVSIGTIPVLGDLFDVAWKTNQRNVRLLERDRRARESTRPQTSRH